MLAITTMLPDLLITTISTGISLTTFVFSAVTHEARKTGFHKIYFYEKAKKAPDSRRNQVLLWLRRPDLNRRPPGYELRSVPPFWCFRGISTPFTPDQYPFRPSSLRCLRPLRSPYGSRSGSQQHLRRNKQRKGFCDQNYNASNFASR